MRCEGECNCVRIVSNDDIYYYKRWTVGSFHLSARIIFVAVFDNSLVILICFGHCHYQMIFTYLSSSPKENRQNCIRACSTSSRRWLKLLGAHVLRCKIIPLLSDSILYIFYALSGWKDGREGTHPKSPPDRNHYPLWINKDSLKT
jgi:hypothetical protein